MKLPGMPARVKVRDGSIVPFQLYTYHLRSRSSSTLNPAASPFVVPSRRMSRQPPVPASHSTEGLNEWPRLHRTGYSGAVGPNLGPRHRHSIAHLRSHSRWTAVHAQIPLPVPVADVGMRASDTFDIRSLPQFDKVPLVTSMTRERLMSHVTILSPSQRRATGFTTAVSSPSLLPVSSVPASESWEDLCKDMQRTAAHFQASLVGLDTSDSWDGLAQSSLVERGGFLEISSSLCGSPDWSIWHQRVLINVQKPLTRWMRYTDASRIQAAGPGGLWSNGVAEQLDQASAWPEVFPSVPFQDVARDAR